MKYPNQCPNQCLPTLSNVDDRAGIEYDGRWKLLHYTMADIYSPVIVAPLNNLTSSTLSIYAVSDLWSVAHGSVSFSWLSWNGSTISDSSIPSKAVSFEVGAINGTLLHNIDMSKLAVNKSDAVLVMNLTATGSLPNNPTPTTFTHSNFFTPTPLSSAALVDPGLTLTHNAKNKSFTVKATKGVSIWTWLDYPSGAVVRFSDNGFLLRKGESMEVTYSIATDSTNGKWTQGVTVESVFNNTLAK